MSEYSIVPKSYERWIPKLIKFGMIYIIIPLGAFILWSFGIVSWDFCFVFLIIFSIISARFFSMVLPYSKIAQSTVHFCDAHLDIRDKQGNIWRRIQYCEITSIRIEKMEGLVSGYNGMSYASEYIVIFMNNWTAIPEGSFYQKYKNPNFFPIYYREEVMERLHLSLAYYNMEKPWQPDS